jgi:hypothetical protein
MKTINLNNREFNSHREMMEAVAIALEENDSVISANYNGQSIDVHELDENGEDDSIEWFCERIHYIGENNAIEKVDIDC